MPAEAKPVSTYQPNKETIGQLLSMTAPSIVVPDWQRNYSWKSEQIDTFWNDLSIFFSRQTATSKGEYFLGSVVIVKTAEGTFKLLDGQQRVATSAILLSSIRDYVSNFNSDAAKQLQNEYLVGFDHVENRVIHKLRLNIYDRDFFRQLVLDDRNADYIEPTPSISSHNQILNARRKFDGYISEFTQGLDQKPAFNRCMELARCLLRQMTVISVYSSDEESAADVFETLNDRGIGLSTPDLLRNLVIRRALVGQEETVVELWRDLISFENDTLIQNFLRHYWISRHGDVKTQSLYREIKGVIIEKNLDSVSLSTSLSNSSEIYRQIIAADTPSRELNKLLAEIAAYGSRSRILYPTILALVESLGVDAALAPSNLVHNVFVRYSIIRNLENSPLESAMYGASREIHAGKNIEKFETTIKSVCPDDQTTKSTFEKLSISHNGSRRNLLLRFELAKRGTEELDIAGADRVHVEHVYPQKPLANEKIENHDRLINRLGNLTLLSARLNIKLQNGSFQTKKPVLSASELLMTQEIAQEAEWGETQIILRQQAMAQQVATLWPI